MCEAQRTPGKTIKPEGLFKYETGYENFYMLRPSQNFSFWESNLRFMGKSGL
jgi:hypothetical protein